MSKKKYLQIIFLVVLFGIAVVTVVGLEVMHRRPQVWQGEVATTELRISGKLGGRIDTLYVKEGQRVKKGDTLVIINSPEARAKYRQADAMEQAAMYQREKVDAGTRVQIVRSAEEVWRKTQSDLRLAEVTLARIRTLYHDSVVTRQRYDETEALYHSAVAAEAVARQQYLLATDGAQTEDKETAASMQQAAEAVTGEVSALLDDAVLTAPEDGEIAVIYPKRGELLGAGMPVMTLLVTAHTHVVLNVREDHLCQFRMGETLEGTVPALGGESRRFHIYYISPLGSYATWRSIRLSGGYDMKTFEVRARAEADSDLRPGMSVLIPREP
jgi:HlyD family secretion protein